MDDLTENSMPYLTPPSPSTRFNAYCTDRVNQVRAFLDAGDLEGLRRFVEKELKRLEKRSPVN